jgi:hypothetical protein
MINFKTQFRSGTKIRGAYTLFKIKIGKRY